MPLEQPNNKPPLNQTDSAWNHIEQTINLLILAMAQIEHGVSDSDKNVSSLGELFTQMADHQQQVNAYLAQQPDTPQDILSHGQLLAQNVNQGVVAFQFYDRLSQRLQHVTSGLGLTKELLADSQERDNPEAWDQVNQSILSHYSLEEEKALFECVLQGKTLQEALAIYQKHHAKQQKQLQEDDDIELFSLKYVG